ncbi:mechanosensitive ion channel family protein [Motilimonas eburnea]|uniref:mechanosensitive ion channel family protein n=1 Tax=Motilimonas eburnea TaxID=1737488 RepID=UPI001E340905|nr:mechanosensitive ion channel family protein [Motilimonas eburnea]MCE2572880.1 mechanosensitive ion channel family protein [Motilimonas eburnea]
MEWISGLINAYKTNNWMFDVTIILLITSVAFVVWRYFAKNMERLVKMTKTGWDDAIWSSVWLPINWVILTVGLALVASVYAQDQNSALLDYIPLSLTLILTGLIAWAFLRFINGAEERFINQGKDETTVNALGKLMKAAVLVITALGIFQTLGFSISGVLAFGGVGGLVVGMAAKDLLANFFGAFVIYLDRPFKVGDWIRSPDRSIEGTVEHIGWRVTIIRTFDKRPLYVPNAIFSSIAVENPSRMSHRRIYETLGIRYADSQVMASIVSDVKAMLQKHDEIDTTQTMIVNFNGFGSSSMDFFVYTFTKTTNWVHYHEVKQDVLLKIMAIIESYDAEFAFPTQTLHIEGVVPEAKVAPES